MRELAKQIARAVALCDHYVILPEGLGWTASPVIDFGRATSDVVATDGDDEPSPVLDTVERAHIRQLRSVPNQPATRARRLAQLIACSGNRERLPQYSR